MINSRLTNKTREIKIMVRAVQTYRGDGVDYDDLMTVNATKTKSDFEMMSHVETKIQVGDSLRHAGDVGERGSMRSLGGGVWQQRLILIAGNFPGLLQNDGIGVGQARVGRGSLHNSVKSPLAIHDKKIKKVNR